MSIAQGRSLESDVLFLLHVCCIMDILSHYKEWRDFSNYLHSPRLAMIQLSTAWVYCSCNSALYIFPDKIQVWQHDRFAEHPCFLRLTSNSVFLCRGAFVGIHTRSYFHLPIFELSKHFQNRQIQERLYFHCPIGRRSVSAHVLNLVYLLIILTWTFIRNGNLANSPLQKAFLNF